MLQLQDLIDSEQFKVLDDNKKKETLDKFFKKYPEQSIKKENFISKLATMINPPPKPYAEAKAIEAERKRNEPKLGSEDYTRSQGLQYAISPFDLVAGGGAGNATAKGLESLIKPATSKVGQLAKTLAVEGGSGLASAIPQVAGDVATGQQSGKEILTTAGESALVGGLLGTAGRGVSKGIGDIVENIKAKRLSKEVPVETPVEVPSLPTQAEPTITPDVIGTPNVKKTEYMDFAKDPSINQRKAFEEMSRQKTYNKPITHEEMKAHAEANPDKFQEHIDVEKKIFEEADKMINTDSLKDEKWATANYDDFFDNIDKLSENASLASRITEMQKIRYEAQSGKAPEVYEKMINNIKKTENDIDEVKKKFNELFKVSKKKSDDLFYALKDKIPEKKITKYNSALKGLKKVNPLNKRDVIDFAEAKIKPLIQDKEWRVFKKTLDKMRASNTADSLELYRKYLPPTKWEKVDMWRYGSMLSSPKTQLINITSNLLGTPFKAINKSITGGIDWIGSKLTGKPQQFFAKEGLEYLKKGYLNKESIKLAFNRFDDVMNNRVLSSMSEMPILPNYPKGVKHQLENVVSIGPRLLKAFDELFNTLSQNGSEASARYRSLKTGKKVNDAKVRQDALESTFNQDLNNPESGNVDKMLDVVPTWLGKMRNSDNPIAKTFFNFTFPFIKIPTNIVKEGINYTPGLGLVKIPGASNEVKKQILAKQVVGMLFGVTAGKLVSSDRMTWSLPTDQKTKLLWEQEGRQPYSIKVGNKWLSYQYLHPAISFPLAFISALKKGVDDRRITQSQLEGAMQGLAKSWNFFMNQAYNKNIGDFTRAMQGDSENAFQYITNYAQQFIPFRGMMTWIKNLVDDKIRRPDVNAKWIEKSIQNFSKTLPILSENVPESGIKYYNPIKGLTDTVISKRPDRVVNSFSPIPISTENTNKLDMVSGKVSPAELTKTHEEIRKLRTATTDLKDAIAFMPKEKAVRAIENIYDMVKKSSVFGEDEKSTYLETLKNVLTGDMINQIYSSELSEDKKSEVLQTVLGKLSKIMTSLDDANTKIANIRPLTKDKSPINDEKKVKEMKKAIQRKALEGLL